LFGASQNSVVCCEIKIQKEKAFSCHRLGAVKEGGRARSFFGGCAVLAAVAVGEARRKGAAQTKVNAC
jgi:hypothetical protein